MTGERKFPQGHTVALEAPAPTPTRDAGKPTLLQTLMNNPALGGGGWDAKAAVRRIRAENSDQ